MRNIALVILTFYTFQVSAQKIRPEIKNLVKKIEKYNELQSEHVGIAGMTTDQYRNFEKLKNKATTEELLKLLNHKNSVVKGYTSWALADNKYPKLANIFAEFLRTGESATTQHGCIVSKDELAREFYHRVLYQYYDNKITEQDSLFFQSQIKQLDSVIFYGKNKTDLLSNALKNNNGNPKTYERIKELALKDKNIGAIEALAIYKREEDIPEFKKLGELAFFGIAKFPDPKFWDFLLSYKSKFESESYLLAVSAFKSEKSAGILTDILKNINEESISYLSEVITKNYCSHYQSLILSIWENYKIIDITATKLLINYIPEKASISFANGLLSNNDYRFLEFDSDYGQSELILPLILENIKKYQNDKMLTICKVNVNSTKFIELATFLMFIKDNKLSETYEAILNRLQQKNIPFEIFHLTDTILSFKNPNDIEKIVSILKTKQEDWDSGNWSEHFRILFKEYNISID
ncbi:hypothetical protein [Flavobacterium cheniae]|uniref:Uncharacterized protein n=1 Tax=Flavobacterium cheniae TaxID=295428 RepID=A0A562KJ91_9FLAO|nr:hypothetical protein [Flavobacterium cheniae]TDR25838.1 hypothetical protein C8D80_0627 [Flavobacterium cheniae]TWH95447.1 hypothetical protein IP97_01123 [Flavobacterium cheniae]